jgi:hypothetical protein
MIEPELKELAKELSKEMTSCPRPVFGSVSWVSRTALVDFMKKSEKYKNDFKFKEKLDSFL